MENQSNTLVGKSLNSFRLAPLKEFKDLKLGSKQISQDKAQL